MCGDADAKCSAAAPPRNIWLFVLVLCCALLCACPRYDTTNKTAFTLSLSRLAGCFVFGHRSLVALNLHTAVRNAFNTGADVCCCHWCCSRLSLDSVHPMIRCTYTPKIDILQQKTRGVVPSACFLFYRGKTPKTPLQ